MNWPQTNRWRDFAEREKAILARGLTLNAIEAVGRIEDAEDERETKVFVSILHDCLGMLHEVSTAMDSGDPASQRMMKAMAKMSRSLAIRGERARLREEDER